MMAGTFVHNPISGPPGGGGGGGDPDAIHDNVAGEIHAVANKGAPVNADELLIEDSADSWNKKRVAISSLPAGGGCYELNVQCGAFSPTDSTTRYFGNLNRQAVYTSADHCPIYIPRSGTITKVDIVAFANTDGSNEDWSLYVRLNAASSTLIATVAAAASPRRWANTGLSIAVIAGDRIAIEMVCPAWATNPVNITFGGYVYVTF